VSSPDGLITVVIGGNARSGTSLLGNMLGSWEDALYLPVEIRLGKLSAAAREGAGGVRAFVDSVAGELERGQFGPWSLGEFHEVRGFRGDVFRSAFFRAFGPAVSSASILRAFVHAMRECRDDGENARIAVVESPGGSEFLFAGLVEADESVRCIQMVRPLLDVYASAKAKYLRVYDPSLRHPINMLQHIVAQWRKSIIQASVNVNMLGNGRVLVVDYDEAKRLGGAFRERLATFVVSSPGESRQRVSDHLSALASGQDMLRSRFVVLHNRSAIPAEARSRYFHLAGWEQDLCRLYDPWIQDARTLSERTAGRVVTKQPAGRLTWRLVGLIARAAIAGPRLFRSTLRLYHGLRLRRLGVETALDTARWMRGRLDDGSEALAESPTEPAVSPSSGARQ
jgi:hypothetical protein